METSSYNTSEEVGGFMAQTCVQASLIPRQEAGKGRESGCVDIIILF